MMFAIAKHELWQSFKNIKAILIIIALLSASYFFANKGKTFVEMFELSSGEENTIYSTGLLLMMMFFGLLFVMALSHDIINRETSNRTMRFLLSRTSHEKIFIGKFLGVWLFWVICFAISVLVIAITSQTISFTIIATLICLVTFEISVAFLLSVLIKKPMMSMFIGIFIGIAGPILASIVEYTEAWYKLFKYVSPLHYLQNNNYEMLALPLGALIIAAISLFIFKRGEY